MFESTTTQTQVPGESTTESPVPVPGPEAATQSPQASSGREFQLIVQRGQQLAEICRKHYGTSRSEVVQALARYNHMPDADHLREGQKLLLPPLESLLGQRH